jgi:hypothetical protein
MARQAADTTTARDRAAAALHWAAQGRRRWWLAAGGLVLLLGIGFLVWPTDDPEPPRARPYREETACLLTAERGVAEEAAKPVWAGMQDASLKTSIKVQFLEVSGPQTVQNAEPFVATLAIGGCNLIFAAGDIPVGAVAASAARFPKQTFVLVGGEAGAANVELVKAVSPAEISSAVSKLLVTRYAKTG